MTSPETFYESLLGRPVRKVVQVRGGDVGESFQIELKDGTLFFAKRYPGGASTMTIAEAHGLVVIEDCAQAPFATYKGRPVGTLGHMGVFSFNYHKHIHTGEGGVVTTNDDGLCERLQLIRNHGEAVVGGQGVANLINMVGFNFRMGEIEAAIARCQLAKGPALIATRQANVAYLEGKLAGFTWNLVERYDESITLQVKEVHADHLRCATFKAADRFQRSDEKTEPLKDSVILDEPALAVQCAILEHRTPCLGFALKEKFHVNINKDQLTRLNFLPGPWLNELKQGIFEGAPESQIITVLVGGNGGTRDHSLGDLKKELVEITPGQKIAYVVDTVFNEENNARIVGLVKGADVFFCESPFVAEDEERARDRCHLTSRQAGLLARQAGVKQLRVFHFSAKHTHQTALLYRQAEEAFHGPL